MPLPKPKDDESKDDFLDRCMGDEAMQDEYPDETQRYAVCNDLWEKKETNADEKYTCECVECGHTVETDEHCKDIECSECGGDMRRKERPGSGQKDAQPEMERRIFPVGEIRVVREDGKPTRIEGYSAVFNTESLNLGFFTEKIAPGAFKNAIKKSDT
jgi:DNA-directed RNA polymerase subunit RPC12/RpoP